MDLCDYLTVISQRLEIKKKPWDEIKVSDLILDNYICLGYGRNRIAFTNRYKRWILKIPITRLGTTDNLLEEETYDRFGRDGFIKYAKCAAFEICGVVCLFMEYVEPISKWHLDKIPEWVHEVDDGQIGYARDGTLVAYDYGSY